MEEIVRKAMLYDFYGELLTPHQRKAYEAVVMDDLSCAELARNENISRQGAHDMIHRCDRQLEEYEEKLHLVERFLAIRDQVKKIEETAQEMRAVSEDKKVQNFADRILADAGTIVNQL